MRLPRIGLSLVYCSRPAGPPRGGIHPASRTPRRRFAAPIARLSRWHERLSSDQQTCLPQLRIVIGAIRLRPTRGPARHADNGRCAASPMTVGSIDVVHASNSVSRPADERRSVGCTEAGSTACDKLRLPRRHRRRSPAGDRSVRCDRPPRQTPHARDGKHKAEGRPKSVLTSSVACATARSTSRFQSWPSSAAQAVDSTWLGQPTFGYHTSSADPHLSSQPRGSTGHTLSGSAGRQPGHSITSVSSDILAGVGQVAQGCQPQSSVDWTAHAPPVPSPTQPKCHAPP